MSKDIKRIGLVRLSAFGDVLLTVPTVRTLQANFPKAKITWIVSPGAYPILEGLSGVEFVVVEKPRDLRTYIAAYKKLKSYSFDVLLCMQASFSANILFPLIKAKRRIGFDTARARDGHRFFVREAVPAGRDHLLDAFMRFAEVLGCTEKKYCWDLNIAQSDRDWVNTQWKKDLSPEKKTFIVNPSCSKPERNWVKERYVQVIQGVKQRWDVNILLTGGPAESEKNLASYIESEVGFPVVNWVGKTTPKQLAVALEKADVLLAPDTGPLHLAGAMGTPVIGLYAVASSGLSGPYFSRNLSIDKFPEAVRKFLKKDPDNIPWKTRVHTQKAMTLITVNEVLEKLAEVLQYNASRD
jgi:heptosyltransferase I